MINTGPIIFIEDDEDDVEIFKAVMLELKVKNRVEWFVTANDAYEYLLHNGTQPFIIICDLNLPGKDGINLKTDIDNNKVLRKKSIPFVFLSTAADKYIIEKCYTEITIQGYFQKENDFQALKKMFDAILNYWAYCRHPNNLN
jgi:CheY-like chemotaxis protein